MKYLIVIIFSLLLSCNLKNKKIDNLENDPSIYSNLDDWQEGYLDIHHINTGSGDACFMVFPDGTTLLFDAGDLDKEKFEENLTPLKATAPIPNDSLSAAKWIARYIKKVMPVKRKPMIDYSLISHFHKDHYGSFVELSKIIPFKNVIDRNYPNYNFPLDLNKYLSESKLFKEYITFVKSDKTSGSSLKVGDTTQIYLRFKPYKFPNFKVQNVKSNGTIWTGNKNKTFTYFTASQMTSFYKGKYNENPLSLALKISYGKFDYFTGGDNTGLQGYGLPKWFDVETPMAKAVGKVEATTLNHHGNRDATNTFFVKTLNPKVVVQQSWCSDHPGQEVYQRLIYKDSIVEDRIILSTNMHKETLITYGPWFKNN